jgi:hypothetical protein
MLQDVGNWIFDWILGPIINLFNNKLPTFIYKLKNLFLNVVYYYLDWVHSWQRGEELIWILTFFAIYEGIWQFKIDDDKTFKNFYGLPYHKWRDTLRPLWYPFLIVGTLKVVINAYTFFGTIEYYLLVPFKVIFLIIIIIPFIIYFCFVLGVCLFAYLGFRQFTAPYASQHFLNVYLKNKNIKKDDLSNINLGDAAKEDKSPTKK